MSKQFLRKYRILVAKGDETVDVSDMRCKFRVEKQWAQQPNMTLLTIYNLSATTENDIIKNAESISIEAGYDNGIFGQIFRGNIIQFYRGKEDSTTYTLNILSLDGDNFLNYGTVAFSLNRGVGQREQIERVAEKSSIPATIGDIKALDNSQKLSRGKVFFGASKDYLRDASKTSNAIFDVDNNVVNIRKVDSIPEGKAVLLNTETGLVGFPSQTDLGVNCKALINPQIIVSGLIQIDNASVNQKQIALGKFLRPLAADGVYRVIKLTHLGDTRGQEWYTTVDAISQGENLIPGLMPTAGSNAK